MCSADFRANILSGEWSEGEESYEATETEKVCPLGRGADFHACVVDCDVASF